MLEENRDVSIDPLTSKVYLDWPLARLTQAGAGDTSRFFVLADLSYGTNVTRNLIYLARTKEVHLMPAILNTSIMRGVEKTREEDGFTITVKSPVLARDVYLSFGTLDVTVSDNYFDILPGESVEVIARTNATLDELKAQMKVVSLTDAFVGTNQPATVSASH
jgi:beta-mannosidase